MLTPKQLDDYPARLVALYHQTECDIIADMAKRIAAKDMFIPASQWQMNKLLEMGAVQSDIEKRLAQALGKTQEEVHRIIEESGYKALKKDAAVFEQAGIDPSQAMQSEAVRQALENGMNQTLGTFQNITRTTVNNATMQYYDALDGAYLQVSSGAFDYTTAITNAIQKLAENGIACATYPSGHKDYLDVAVRRATLTGLNQAALHAQEALSDELGNDLVEVTAHAGARTGDGVANHASWQGKVYSRSGNSLKYPSLRVATGYGTGAGLGGWNCRHSFFPFIEGASERAYTDQELEELNEPKYEYNGKKMTEYEATQRQRYIERQIRRYKRDVAGLDAAGIDCTDSRNQLAKWQKRQTDFIDQTGLKRDYSREVVEGYRPNTKKTEKSASNAKKTVAKGEKSGIIKEKELSPRKSKETANAVNWEIIQSDEYSNKFSKLSSDKKISSAIETRAKWALNNRDGMSSEELYAISLRDGREICRITDQYYESAVKRTEDFSKKLDNADKSGDNIILLHNHPKGLPPSIADINNLMRNKNVIGITVGHDGSVYKYTRPISEIPEDDWNIALKHFKEFTEVTSMEKALKLLSKKFLFVFEKL